MSEAILSKYIENGGEFETIGKLYRSKLLTREMYNCPDKDFEEYIEMNNDVDYVDRYISYCK